MAASHHGSKEPVITDDFSTDTSGQARRASLAAVMQLFAWAGASLKLSTALLLKRSIIHWLDIDLDQVMTVFGC